MPRSIYTLRKGIALAILMIISISFTLQSPETNLAEKIYTQTDRSFYFPGETIWFKSYVTNTSHKITSMSEILYAELISPKGAVVNSWDLSIRHGYAYGHFDLKKDWVGGIYTLKMYTQWMRNYGEDAFFTKKITVQKVVQPNLLLSLKFKKEGYGKAEEVVADFEVKDLKNNPLSNKEISCQISVKGKKTNTYTIKTDAKGKANPIFKLPADLSTTDVLLNVLIPYKGSTESISRSVPVLLDTVDLQFFSESGKIVAGAMNTVAFKAVNEFGKPADVSGNILDEEGIIVSTFESYHDGMGGFDFIPKSGVSYVAQITKPFLSEKKISLPTIFNQGVRFSVTTDSIQAKLQVFSTLKESLRLEITTDTKLFVKQDIPADQKELFVNTQKFPRGITRFTLFDKENIPVAERLVFLNKHQKLNIDLSLEKKYYETREKVKVKIRTTGENNIPIPSNLSVSVADNKLLSFADDKQDHIESYLLMSSELKGKIHKPVFYFDPEEAKADKALDYVMLTHGWRNYLITDELSISNALYKPELKSVQSGTVIDRKGNPISAHIVLFEPDGTKALAFDTGEDGKYSFKVDKTAYTMIAYTDKGHSLRILKDQQNTNSYTTRIPSGILDSTRVLGFITNEKPLQNVIKKKAEASIALQEDSAALEEVTIIGYGVSKIRNMTGAISAIASEDIFEPEPIPQILQGKISGVQVIGADGIYGNSSKISIRGAASISGNNQPLIVVDGVVVDSQALTTINPDQVDSVTVLKDASATAIYGCRAANGVIIVSHKNRNHFSNWNKKKLNNARFNNYAVEFFNHINIPTNYIEKQFYVPVYEGVRLPLERTDFRKTIYWNPVVQTDENGEATLEFYNSDAITSFKIIAEGIGYNGVVGRQEEAYSTKKMLNLDFRVPNYLTMKDTISMPVTITNESDVSITATLDLKLPKTIKLVESIEDQVVVEANASVLKNIRIIPIQKSERTSITVAVNSREFQDVVTKDVIILSPYFPTEVSISGSKNQSFTFDIHHVVDQSLSAEFSVYTDIVGDVMNGIESLIRKPYGCFEQTSSSTYPNVLILKYLKESGKTNPDIEKRAMQFIKEGYKKLAAYETKEHGFEWYGDTPPHEALSAYGLMEFMEMKEVYSKVDEKMIQRTIEWLMSRRNQKGGFKQKRGKYGFSAAPEVVNNAYIVYALSESGITTDINTEYEATYKEALKSGDTYRMALMAAASFNFGEKEKGNTLLLKIKEKIAKYGFEKLPVSNTITRSYGNASNIETVAFTLLALMKQENKDEIVITKGIEYLVSKRQGGRFGSTQSTCMALKALIEYTKNQKRKIIGQNKIELMINGSKITKELITNADGKIVIKGLAKYIKEGKQKVEVLFKDSNNVFPFAMDMKWDSTLPDSSDNCKVHMTTTIADTTYKIGDNARMNIQVSNTTDLGLPMITAIIGIPSGTSPQPWQLKEILEKNQVAFYEIFDNYLVFYWREFGASERKEINLDLKVDVAGRYRAPASTVYQYYTDEHKHWIPGNYLKIIE